MKLLKKISLLILGINILHAQNSKPKLTQKISGIFSYYKYTEPDVMNSNGLMSGFEYGLDFPFSSGYTLMLQAKLIGGSLKYKSKNSGSMPNDRNLYIDVKPLLGQRMNINATSSICPYAGLGFRHLKNHSSENLSTTGHSTYLRTNKLFYIPFGFIHTFKLNQGSYIESNIEGSIVVLGKQFSELKGRRFSSMPHFSVYTEDHYHTQNKGYGFKFSTYYHQEKWFIGPYFQYWNIDESSTNKGKFINKLTNNEGYSPTIEPKNNTIEAGFSVGLKF